MSLEAAQEEVSSVAKKFETCYKKAMKRPRLIVGSLAVVHLVLAVVAFCYFNSGNTFLSVFPGLFLFMLFPSQGSLIGIWTALGGKRTPLRVILTFIGIILCLRVGMSSSSYDIKEAFAISATQIVSITMMLLICRLTGLRIETTPLEPWKPEPFQFTILQIMTWTAIVAVIMSALHYFPEDTTRIFPEVLPLLGTAASLGNVALLSMWLVFGKKRLPLRVLAVLAAIGTGAWLLGFALDHDWMYFATLLSFEAIWTILSLLVIRWAGYRMTWHWRLRRFKEPVKADAG